VTSGRGVQTHCSYEPPNNRQAPEHPVPITAGCSVLGDRGTAAHHQLGADRSTPLASLLPSAQISHFVSNSIETAHQRRPAAPRRTPTYQTPVYSKATGRQALAHPSHCVLDPVAVPPLGEGPSGGQGHRSRSKGAQFSSRHHLQAGPFVLEHGPAPEARRAHAAAATPRGPRTESVFCVPQQGAEGKTAPERISKRWTTAPEPSNQHLGPRGPRHQQERLYQCERSF
jgi:hypothetical protein